MTLILCTGLSETLLRTRRFMLEMAQTRVRKRQVFQFVKKHSPDTKVLEIYRPYNGRSLAEADDWLESPTLNPADLIAKVEALARRDGQ